MLALQRQKSQVIEVINYISDDDWSGSDDEEVETIVEEVVTTIPSTSTRRCPAPHEVGIGQEYGDDDDDDDDDDSLHEDDLVEIVEEVVQMPSYSSHRWQNSITVAPHEVGIGAEPENYNFLQRSLRYCSSKFLTAGGILGVREDDDESEEEEEVVEFVEEVVRPPFSRMRSTRTIAPHEVGIGVQQNDNEDDDDDDLLHNVPNIPTKTKKLYYNTDDDDDDSISITSITSRTTASPTEPLESLGVMASMRMSLVAAKAVKKLRERLVTAQLRQRMKEHRNKYAHAQAQQQARLQQQDFHNSWRQIIGAIETVQLKPVPKTLKRDSSNYVSKDHPYLRELRAVQAEVLPVWRKETYSYWI
ncbi:expressed unknown protein [Seminavis robusta]|uniref:Uncharacterized protein n=1 Tax=Seminavis robusta TaxID=568900 RepID=A0A9N8EIU8_9STRA|nr:expressed unknown protein [Seminavis robusta]|eukprot:Sro1025_g232750.1 n/a (360) ;mRNA; r:13031-14110